MYKKCQINAYSFEFANIGGNLCHQSINFTIPKVRKTKFLPNMNISSRVHKHLNVYAKSI